MKRFSEFIIEKLKVSNNNRSYDVTLESLIKALKDYKDRKHYEYSVYVDLKEILEEYPVVLDYHGTNTDKNIKGNEILSIQFIQYITAYRKYMKDGKDSVFIHLYNSAYDSLKIETTEELYDIFDEETVIKIYDYIITH